MGSLTVFYDSTCDGHLQSYKLPRSAKRWQEVQDALRVPGIDRSKLGWEHPDSSERTQAILDAVLNIGTTVVQVRTSSPVDEDQIALCHSLEYVRLVKDASRQGSVLPHGNLLLTVQSFEAALASCGTAVSGVYEVLCGASKRAFCLSRPPGHHAGRSTGGGFCLFNNVSVAAAYALKRLHVEKIAIVDWDYHHGNGTQEIFWNESRVLYTSLHASGRWPYSGLRSETGGDAAKGANVNVPLLRHARAEDIRHAFVEELLPQVAKFKPELILVSCGFDAMKSDPIGSWDLGPEDVHALTSSLVEVARDVCEGRIVSVLEGGYRVESLRVGAESHIRALASE